LMQQCRRSRLQDAADQDASTDDPFAGFDPDPTGVPADEPEPVEDPDYDAAHSEWADRDSGSLDEVDDDASSMRGGEDLFDLG